MKFLLYVCCFFLLFACQDASFYEDGIAAGEINLPDNREQDEDDNSIDEFGNCGELNHGESIDLLLFEKQVVEFGEQCLEVDVTKSCNDGEVSYTSNNESVNIDDYYEECEITDPMACGNIPHDGQMSRTRFEDLQVAYGETCKSEVQTSVCYNGSLSNYSGTYEAETCEVGDAKSCGALGHGSSETRMQYENASVAHGDTCKSEEQSRTCNNGELSEWSGSYSHATCLVEDANSCGSTAHQGVESRVRYQDDNVDHGGTCVEEQQTRTCTNGDFSAWTGTYTNEFCVVGEPKDCGALEHMGSETRVKFEKLTVGFNSECQSEEQNRTCNDGALSQWSGSYNEDSCSVDEASSCGDLGHNSSETRIRFKSNMVSHGGLCESETQSRQCHNGELSEWSGSYTEQECLVKDPENCGNINHGDSEDRIRYESSVVSYNQTCSSEKQVRTCSDGEMSNWTGSYDNETCVVQDPATCGDTNHNETQSRMRYKQSSVEFGNVCESEKQVRTCSNGDFSSWSGSYTALSCDVSAPAACGNILSGSVETRTRYFESSVAYGGKCESQVQTRLCTNGNFGLWSGTYINLACTVQEAANCGDIAHGQSETRQRYLSSLVGFGEQCKSETQMRVCNNGTLDQWSGSYEKESCEVDVAKSCFDAQGVEVKDGGYEVRSKYKSAVILYGEICEQEEQKRQCINGSFGQWSGSFTADECAAATPKNCGDIIHGGIEVRVRYEQDVIDKDQSCKSEEQKRECVNGELGQWSGTYEEETCRKIRNCIYQGGMIAHGENVSRVRFRTMDVPAGQTCEQEEQFALCEDGIIGEFDGGYEHEKCEVRGQECQKGKVLTIMIDKDGDGLGDTEPVEIISYKGQYNNADNYNYYSWSAHPHIGPNPDGYKSHAFLYEGPDGLSFQFYFNKDKIAGENYNGSPNSVVNLDILTEGNNYDDAVILADDKNELKYRGEVSGQNLYEGRFHYWYNTDGGVIGPFNGEDYKIIVKPIESYELYKVNGVNERRDAFNGATFYSADGTVVQLDDQDGNFHSYIIQFKEDMTCEEHEDQEVTDVGCADGNREGFKDIGKFKHIAGCAGGFANEGVLPQHRYRDESCKGIGNNSDNPNGQGCGIRNICAKGWEVLPSVSALGSLTDGGYCHAMEQDYLTQNIAFVTGVTSQGVSKVYDKDEDLLNAILNYEQERQDYLSMGTRNYLNHVNDLFYCGGDNVASKPFNNALKYFTTFSYNACAGARGFASCNSVGGFFEADRYVQSLSGVESTRGLASSEMKGGGVVCVRSSQIDDLEIEDDLRGEEDELEELFCENIIQNGSFEIGHSLSGDAWNTYREVAHWFADSKYSDAGIEIQCGNAGPRSSDQDCNLELDAHHDKNGFSESDAGVNQVISLKKGRSYNLSFDIFARSSKSSSNEMSVFINGEEVFAFSSNDKNWVRQSISFVAKRSGRQVLSLRGNKDSDTIGANIDNVVLIESECMDYEETEVQDVTASTDVEHHYNPEKENQSRFKLSCASLKAGEQIPAETLSKMPESLRNHIQIFGVYLSKQCGSYKSFFLDYVLNEGKLEELKILPNYYK